VTRVRALALAVATLGAVAAAPCAAQPPLTVAAGVRALGGSAPVTVAGRASVGTDALMRRAVYVAIQDDSAGLWVFSKSVEAQLRAGDSVVVTGLVHRYRGMVELVADSVRVVPSAPRLPAPLRLPAAGGALAAHEGQLVTVRGTAGAHGVSEGGRWMRLHARPAGTAPPDSVTLWVGPTHVDPPQLADVVAGDELEVTGVAAAYRDNPGDAHVWQVVPRSPADVAVIGISRRWYGLAARIAVLVAALGAGVALAARALTRRHALALAETDARYRQLLELSPDAVLVHDGGRVLFANPAAARLLGVADERALSGRPLDDFVPAEERALLASVTPAAGGRRVRTRVVGAGGAPVDVEAATSPCRYHDREAAVIVARDIGAQLRYERELRELALLDELTGLQNRRGFLTFADAELRRTWQAGRGALLAFADLDGLKQINDLYGHAAGDTALGVVARALRETAGGEGLVARWGGDEFVALVAEGGDRGGALAGAADDAEAADAFERRLSDAIARLATPGLPFTIRASVGLRRLAPGAEESLATALADADARLYRRKALVRAAAPASATPAGD
jgi:diguanylate cyclase (GGDEF)-like protein/PAS domain S-box-containing protein